jgi:hypothetical protein
MVSMSDELKERNILKLILIARFACATLDVGHPIQLADGQVSRRMKFGSEQDKIKEAQNGIYCSTEFCRFLEFARSGNCDDF